MQFFAKYPKTLYSIDGGKVRYVLTDIMRKVMVNKEVRNSGDLFYYHDVKDGERPEHIAHNIYGDSRYYWMILEMNEIQNPYFDWPLSSREMDYYLEKKYPYQTLILTANVFIVDYSSGSCNGDFNTINAVSQLTSGASAQVSYFDNANSKIYLTASSGTFDTSSTIQQDQTGTYVGISGPITLSSQANFTINTNPSCTTRIYQAESFATGKAVAYDASLQQLVVNVSSGTFSTSYPIREINGDSSKSAIVFATVLSVDAPHHYENEDGEIVSRMSRPAAYSLSGVTYDYGTTDLQTGTSQGRKGPVTNREFEELENEEKRKIKIMKPQYVTIIQREFERKMAESLV